MPEQSRQRWINKALAKVLVLALMLAGIPIATVGIAALNASPAIAAPAAITVGNVETRLARLSVSGSQGVYPAYECLRDLPIGETNFTRWVSSGTYSPGDLSRPVSVSHGKSNSGPCPSALNYSQQSVISAHAIYPGTVTEGQPFLAGVFTHYNNPVYNPSSRYYSQLGMRMLGGSFSFPFNLWETPNSEAGCPPGLWQGNGNCQDVVQFDTATAPEILNYNGNSYRLVISGFANLADGEYVCPATPPAGTAGARFHTNQNAATHSCMYTKLEQIRHLTIVKKVQLADGSQVPSSVSIPRFGFTSGSDVSGSSWENNFTITPTATHSEQISREVLSSENITVTENKVSGDQWSTTGLSCVDQNGNELGMADGKGVATQLTAAGATIKVSNLVGMDNSPTDLTCTITNTYQPKATLTLAKSVTGGSATPNQFALSASGPTPINGLSGSSSVTRQRVNAGTYTLDEASLPGYVRQGPWSCTGARVAGENVVEIPDGANVECLATNRYATGSLEVKKQIVDPFGGYTGSDDTNFIGTVTCATPSGETFNFAASPASPWKRDGIPAGSQCRVTGENPPSAALLKNPSYAWRAPSIGPPVMIGDGKTSAIGLTNTIDRVNGYLSIGKVVAPAAGTNPAYIGASERKFKIDYACVLAGEQVAGGSVSLAADARTPAIPVPIGATCTIEEVMPTRADGDFPDSSYNWLSSQLPAPVTITSAHIQSAPAIASVTNTYERRYGSLTLVKAVTGPGAVTVEPAKTFNLTYDCGTGFKGKVAVNAGGSATVPGLPQGVMCTVGESDPPVASDGLAPAFAWSGVSYPDGRSVTISDKAQRRTIANATVPVYAQLRIAKAVTGDTAGVVAGAPFRIDVTCNAPAEGHSADYRDTFAVTASSPELTPNLPVGASCTVSEQPATPDQLVNESYVWGPHPKPQTTAVGAPGSVSTITTTNTVTRAYGSLTITKVVLDPEHQFAGGTFAGVWSCTGNSTVSGTWQVENGGNAVLSGPFNRILYGSNCTVTEPNDPKLKDGIYAWKPPVFTPSQSVTVSAANPSPRVTVTNAVVQLDSHFAIQQVTSGRVEGIEPGASFTVTATCHDRANTANKVTNTWYLGANEIQSTGAGGLPIGWRCTLTQSDVDGGDLSNDVRFKWGAVKWSTSPMALSDLDSETSADGYAVSFTVPKLPSGQVGVLSVDNAITVNLVDFEIAKQVSGETAGYTGEPVEINYSCGDHGVDGAGTVSLAHGYDTIVSVPAGSSCRVTEGVLGRVALKDESYDWQDPSYSPAQTVIIAPDGSSRITVNNTVNRVVSSLSLTKVLTDPDSVVDKGRNYQGTWNCVYTDPVTAATTTYPLAGTGNWTISAGKEVVLASDIPIGAKCTATEDLSAPPTPHDSSYKWADAITAPVTIVAGGESLISVSNEVKREHGSLYATKVLAGATEGYVGGDGANFNIGYTCENTADPGAILTGNMKIPAGDGKDHLISDSIPMGWRCTLNESQPDKTLLADSSYTWGDEKIEPAQVSFGVAATEAKVTIINPIARANGALEINVALKNAPTTAVTGTFFGDWSCQFGTAAPVTGTWEAPAAGGPTKLSGGSGTPGQVLSGSVCTVTSKGKASFTDPSWRWTDTSVDPANVTITPGANTAVAVTYTAEEVFATFAITKSYVGDPHALVADAKVTGTWQCDYRGNPDTDVDDHSFTGQWTLPAIGGTWHVPKADGSPLYIPFGSTCTAREHTLDPKQFINGSYDWKTSQYTPATADGDAGVVLVGDGANEITITNDIERVYGSVVISKEVVATNNAIGWTATTSNDYAGTWRCIYDKTPGEAPTVAEGAWNTQVNSDVPATYHALVGSTCSLVAEDNPPVPVAGDPSFVWTGHLLGAPATIPPPGTDATLTVTNTFDRLVGSVGMVASIVGTVPEAVAAQEMTVDWSCTPANGDPVLSGQIKAKPGQLWNGPNNIPAASKCSFAVQTPTAIPNYTWGTPAWVVENASEGDTIHYDGDHAVGSTRLAGAAPLFKLYYPVVHDAFSITKVADPPSSTTVKPGDKINYTVTLTPASGTSTNVEVTDNLAAVLDYAMLDTASISASGGTARVEGSTLRWSIDKLSGGGVDLHDIVGHEGDPLPVSVPLTLTYTVTVANDAWGAVLSNGVSVTSDNECIGDCAPKTSHPVPGFAVSKTADPPSGAVVASGEVITYHLTATNDGAAAVTGAEVVDDLTEVLNSASYLGTTATVPGSATLNGTALTWKLDSLGPGETATLAYQVKVFEDASDVTIKNKVTSSAGGACRGECVTTHRVPGWNVTKSADPPPGTKVTPGDTVAYTLTVRVSALAAAAGIEVSDDLGEILNNADIVAGSLQPGQGTATVTGSTLKWAVGEVAAGTAVSLNYQVRVHPDASGTLHNKVIGTGNTVAGPSSATDTKHPISASPLPRTGADPSGLIALGLAFLLAGCVLLALRRAVAKQ